jgi:hypothetical protein
VAPLAHVSLKIGRSDAFLADVADAIYESLRAIFTIPKAENRRLDRFAR